MDGPPWRSSRRRSSRVGPAKPFDCHSNVTIERAERGRDGPRGGEVMATYRRLKVGLIGSGLIAQGMHLHHLRELADLFDVSATWPLSATRAHPVCDPDR